MSDLYIRDDLTIPAHELSVRSCRSSGPGGQHVNKSNTKVQLSWLPVTSVALTPEQRELITSKLSYRLSKRGALVCSAEGFRSQQRNIEEARVRLAGLIQRALHVPKERIATRPTRASKERRLKAKHERSSIKASRRRRDWS
jgi:ribosome-associated protein